MPFPHPSFPKLSTNSISNSPIPLLPSLGLSECYLFQSHFALLAHPCLPHDLLPLPNHACLPLPYLYHLQPLPLPPLLQLYPQILHHLSPHNPLNISSPTIPRFIYLLRLQHLLLHARDRRRKPERRGYGSRTHIIHPSRSSTHGSIIITTTTRRNHRINPAASANLSNTATHHKYTHRSLTETQSPH